MVTELLNKCLSDLYNKAVITKMNKHNNDINDFISLHASIFI